MTQEPHTKPARAWQRMLSGRRLDLLDPDPADIDIRDIAHGLARVARWNGQTIGHYAFSVAQHALIVEAIAALPGPRAEPWSREWALAALLHDAPEFVVGDLISPFKAAVGPGYKALEQRLLRAVHMRFGLPADLPEAVTRRIKWADGVAAYHEATQLAGFGVAEAVTFFGGPPELGATAIAETLRTLTALPTADAQTRFLHRFEDLSPLSMPRPLTTETAP